ncbi:MAG: 1-deoxy-D-xylulose-5-phosphate synthase [Lachnospiraceae bacterium]|nr:1-deoxy-D-xylulose-5-phosphate synthase [Candidatus Merdinaster equi]
MFIEKLNAPNDIKKIKTEDLPELAEEIRQFLIEKVSINGGHLGSNLGAVELTLALHMSLDLPKDKIVWDVGHQAYTHKILTGRRDGFDNLRKHGGMSGFPKRHESDCDAFDTGHSSTSISAGLGLVKARDIKGEKGYIVSVIGDGALTGGMAYEALNNAAKLESNFIIILNDNNMSISENVGGMSKYLNGIRTATSYLNLKEDVYARLKKSGKAGEDTISLIRKAKSSIKNLFVPGMLFENMGITYLGPVDGHNIKQMTDAIREAKRFKKAVLIHVKTQKGKGYGPAEKHPARFHGAEPFEIETGLPLKPRDKANYSDVFATVMCKLGERNKDVVAITAAMPDGTGLKRFRHMYPERFFDVGIAEEHAVTFAAGLAAGGLRPIVCIYSSFLQRAYDQILHDVCIQNLPVVFAIDRAGIVGSDGETHQGVFDISFMSNIPNMTVMAPKNKWELSDMMKYALTLDGPSAIRYPRGMAYDGLQDFRMVIEKGVAEVIYRESDIALFALGSMIKVAEDVRSMLKEKGYHVSLINARFAKPVDEEMIMELAKDHSLIVTLEENVFSGGLGEYVQSITSDMDVKTLPIAIPDRFVEHGSYDLLLREMEMDAESIVNRILNNR